MLNVTPKANSILGKLFHDFEKHYIEQHETEEGTNCNQNDIERAFLQMIGEAMVTEGVFSMDTFEATDLPDIEAIQ